MREIEKEISEALSRLDLPIMITKNDIKKRYRQLARQYHPDISESDTEMMELINQSYELLMKYIESFRYRFDKEEITRQYPGVSHAQKFKP